MFQVFIIVAVLIAIAVAGLSIGILVKGKFPETHVGHNAEMKKLGIKCAKDDSDLCQGRLNSELCRGCNSAK